MNSQYTYLLAYLFCPENICATGKHISKTYCKHISSKALSLSFALKSNADCSS